MPATVYLQDLLLQQEFGGVPYPVLATQFIGLMSAPLWHPNTTVTPNSYIVGTAFSSSNRHIYLSSQGGTTGSTEPTWNQQVGAQTLDGSITWTEATYFFNQGNFSNVEPTGNAYTRVPYLNNFNGWTPPQSMPPGASSITYNNLPIQFPSSTGAWGYISGFFVSDHFTQGNTRSWGLIPQQLAVLTSGIAPSFPPGALGVIF